MQASTPGRHTVRSRLKLWPGFPFRRITSAWGVALEARGVSLVSLVQTAAQEVRVQRTLYLLPPAWAQESDSHHDWLVQALGEVSGQEVRRHRRLVVALPTERCRSGRLQVPTAWSLEALLAEVQLGAAESLGVEPGEVSFDFERQPHLSDNPAMQVVHWLACLRSEVQAWHSHTRIAGWTLPAMEHQTQAARRALQALRGGTHSLQTCAHQDWRFDWPGSSQAASDEVLDHALQPLHGTPTWAWLSACGAGLRALS